MKYKPLTQKADEVRVLILDLDGTLTNGIFTVSSNEVVSKSFNTRDFSAIERFLTVPYSKNMVVILTKSTDMCLEQQIKRLPYASHPNLFWDNHVNDKRTWIEERGINWEEVAFMGDSYDDLLCMEVAAITGCPSLVEQREEEENVVYDNSDFISSFPGGDGAVCEFINYLFKLKNCYKMEKMGYENI